LIGKCGVNWEVIETRVVNETEVVIVVHQGFMSARLQNVEMPV
jgi:hypothetical protein